MKKQSIGRPITEPTPDWYVPLVGVAAHTIGHREITIINNSTIGDDNNDNNSYDASNDGTDSGSNANLSTIGVADTFTGSTVSESNEIRQLVSIRGRFSDWLYLIRFSRTTKWAFLWSSVLQIYQYEFD